MATPLLSLRGIAKTYHAGGEPIPVLHGIDLTVGPGEYVAVMGPSGSGKSTLLNLLGLLDRPDGGEYRLLGRPVQDLDDDDLAGERTRSIGFIFQGFNLFTQQDVVGNITAPMAYARVPRRERRERAVALAERFGLGHRLRNRPSQLSGGEQQRVAIARALANHPPLLLADEPTGNLDAHTGAEVLKLFDELVAAGTTVIMVTHNPDYRQRVQRVLDMHDGRLVAA